MIRKRFQEGGKTPPKKSQIYVHGSDKPRDYNPFEDLHRKYRTPGTALKSTDLPNQNPRMRELTEEEMKPMTTKKKYAKGGFVPFGKKGAAKGKFGADEAKPKGNPFAKAKKPFAEGGEVDVEKDMKWASKYRAKQDAGDISDRVGDRPAANPTASMPKPKPKARPMRRKPSVNMSDAMAKIEAHEARKRARDNAESGSSGPGYASGGRVGYAAGGAVARGCGAALRGKSYKSS